MRSIFRPVLISSFLLISVFCVSQSNPEIETITQDQYNLKECSFDKEADAVVIFDKATSNYDDEYRLVTTRRIRIKILKDNGIERANIKIPYYSKDDFELIRKIDGFSVTTGANGDPEWSHLDKKSIYKRKINELYSEVSFALPNVKAGSIIEYGYESIMEHYGGLNDWYFQTDIPVMFSYYNLYVVPNAVFTYVVKKSPALDVDIQRDAQTGRISFAMKHIPGLRGENYSPSFRNYLQRIDFQLSAVTRYGQTIKYTTTWQQLNKELLEDKNFGGALKRSLAGSDDVKPIWDKAGSPYERMVSIFNYVRSGIIWNDIESKYAMNHVKSVLADKKGSSGEINLLLINLLRGAGLNVFPLLVSERSHGKVDTTYSFLDQFNKVVGCVEMEGKKYILDATDYYTPVNMIPVELLNTIGFVVDKKNPGFILLRDEGKKRYYHIDLKGTVSDNLMLSKTRVSQYDYARVGNAEKYAHNKEAYRGRFVQGVQNIEVDSFEIHNLDIDSAALIHEFNIKQPLNRTGNYYLLNYNFFTGFDKNPFISENRFTNIDFGAETTCILNAVFKIPESFTIEPLPKNIKLMIPGGNLVAAREMSLSGQELRVSLLIDIKSAEFKSEEYPSIQEFFRRVAEMLNEPVLLKGKP